MGRHYWLFMLVTALSWFNTGVVWLIQFACYPLWRLVGQEEFLTYHNVWWQSTWWVVFLPTVLLATGSILMLRLAPPGCTAVGIMDGLRPPTHRASFECDLAISRRPAYGRFRGWTRSGSVRKPCKRELGTHRPPHGVCDFELLGVDADPVATLGVYTRPLVIGPDIGPGTLCSR